MSWINILGKFKSIVLVQYYIVFSLTLKLALLCWCIEFNVFDKRDILSKFHVLPQTTILGFTVTTSFIFLIHIHVPNIKGMLLVYTLYCMTKGQVKGQNSPCDASLKCVQDIDSTLIASRASGTQTTSSFSINSMNDWRKYSRLSFPDGQTNIVMCIYLCCNSFA